MIRRPIRRYEHIEISEKLDTFIDQCLRRGGIGSIVASDVVEWVENDMVLLAECEALEKAYGRFYFERKRT